MSLSLRFKILLKVLSLEGEKGFAQNACLKSILKKKRDAQVQFAAHDEARYARVFHCSYRTESALQIRSNQTKNVLAYRMLKWMMEVEVDD